MNNRELLTVRDLAVDYAIPESSLRVLRQQEQFIPAYRVGRRLLYRLDELEAWLAARAEDARDRASSNGLTALQIARLRDVSADAGLTSEQIDRLADALTRDLEQSAPEPSAGGDR